ncbi:hypothetical protein SAMN05444266_103452 [Chitinophaga jiangningensis]|uniref:Uncharacterized protein n=1 Tax=Chitinophaga jiangningensis TaxID=1419482 RepID=A0A1M7AY21_9BACT|nr:DUF6660 family protein [Chitinophaga jiangningensis]SHL47615.1 hypothetical protein SAMN05444266_103452 [Chitinophaga jiangningensis]
MKLLVYIFSLYLLVLSCIPCNDALAAVPGISLTTISTAPAEQHADHVDFCSPLCVCSCCNVQLTTVSHWQYVVIHPQQQYIYPVYTASIAIAGSNAIWQPPRPVAA